MIPKRLPVRSPKINKKSTGVIANAHNECMRTACLNPFRRWSSVTRVKVGFRISAKCAGSAALHSTVLVSLSHMNTIWSNTADCAVAHTLSDTRISPRMCGTRTFHE